MDEFLGHWYLRLAGSHGFGLANRRSQSQQFWPWPSAVKNASQRVKGNSPGHGHGQSQNWEP